MKRPRMDRPGRSMSPEKVRGDKLAKEFICRKRDLFRGIAAGIARRLLLSPGVIPGRASARARNPDANSELDSGFRVHARPGMTDRGAIPPAALPAPAQAGAGP